LAFRLELVMSVRFESIALALRPSRALLHPLWLVSLAVLVLNDHVLKGSGLLPGVVTGKLSDVAGLVVAPALLAALVRVRGPRGWLLAHAAVGLVFSAIKLSASAAALWSTAMAAVGFPWVITLDPTDLFALPALALSAWTFLAIMQRPAAGSARRTGELVAAGTGLVCCAATSPPPAEPFFEPLWTDVYVHNDGDEPLVVRTRALAPSVDLDCSAVAEDPGRLLTEPLFGTSESFLLEPDQSFGLRISSSWNEDPEFDEDGNPIDRDCYAVLLDVDGLPPAVAFWQLGSVPEHNVPGVGEEDGEPRGRIELMPSGDPDTLGSFEARGDDVVFEVPDASPPVEGACAPQSDAGRIEWSNAPLGNFELLALDRGPDGCFGFDLGIREVDDQILVQHRWYLCAPLTELPFTAGRLVAVETNSDGLVIVSTVDGLLDQPAIELQAARGSVFPEFRGVQVAAVPDFDCGHQVAETCGTVTRATSVTAGGGEFEVFELAPGERATSTSEAGVELTVALAHAEERAALDPECAEGRDLLGLDLEAVAVLVTPPAG
jgi:hypothetical protein